MRASTSLTGVAGIATRGMGKPASRSLTSAVPPGLRAVGAKMPTIAEFLCGGERRVPRGPLPSMNPLEAWGKAPSSGLRATWLGGTRILDKLEAANFDMFTHRPTLTGADVPVILWRTALWRNHG